MILKLTCPRLGEKVVLGSDVDYFVGTAGDEYVVTGGGSDSIYAGAGDDIINVKGGGENMVTVESLR